MPADPKSLIERYNRLKGVRDSHWSSLWQDLATYIQPRKSNIVEEKSPGIEAYTQELYNMTVSDANMVLAAGIMTEIMPASDRWMAFEAPPSLKAANRATAKVESWLQKATEIHLRELARSNFYEIAHEAMLDRNNFGTSATFAIPGRKRPIVFKVPSIGKYVIDVDEDGDVDTIITEFRLTARQARLKWPKGSFGKMLSDAASAGDSKAQDKQFRFLHAVYPRPPSERQEGALTPEQKPVVSCYVCVDDKHIVEEGGFDEMPVAVTRFLAWPEEVWGWGPGMDCLPIVRQVNFIEKQLDALAEKAAFPPFLIPDSLAGEIDVRAAGKTVFPESLPPHAVPREWQTQGRYDIGLDRLERKERAIRKAFHNDLFQMFEGIDPGKMTAYETMQRASEKLTLFTPTFHRLTHEYLTPLQLRVFSVFYREGLYGEAPPELLQVGPNGAALMVPSVSYTSRMSLAIRALENRSFVEFINIMAPIVAQYPEAMDNFNIDRASVGVARNLGLRADWIRDPEAVVAMRDERAQAAQKQTEIANAQGIGKAAKDLGSAPRSMQEAGLRAMG
jgi:hypothetical protein